jgi:hypothetical protein
MTTTQILISWVGGVLIFGLLVGSISYTSIINNERFYQNQIECIRTGGTWMSMGNQYPSCIRFAPSPEMK